MQNVTEWCDFVVQAGLFDVCWAVLLAFLFNPGCEVIHEGMVSECRFELFECAEV